MYSHAHALFTSLALQIIAGFGLVGGSASTMEEDQSDIGAEPMSADSCIQVRAWIERNQDSLPSTYETIARFPPQYRKAIVVAQSPAIQSRLWRTHLERYIAEHPALTAEQSAVLELAVELATPALFAMSEESFTKIAGSRSLAELGRRATSAFGAGEARAVLEEIGREESATAYRPFCQCSTLSDYCVGSRCRFGLIPCIWTGAGCGTFLRFSCNGICG
jgi:hypothetical protein